MASVAKRPNGKWRARYRDADGKEHARHFSRQTDAKQWLNEVTAALVTGDYIDPRAGRVTLETYAADWQASHVGGEAAARIVDNALRLHILPALGSRPLAALRRSHVQGVVKVLSEQLAPGSVRNVYDVLYQVLDAAVEDRKIARNPCGKQGRNKSIRLPELPDEEIVPPTIEDVQRISAAMPERYRAAVLLLAGSGLRIGELLGLRVSDVDFLRRAVRVDRQRNQAGALVPPKTRKSRRTVPVGQVVVDALAAHLAAYPSGEWLFTTEDGGPLAYRRWKAEWNAVHAGFQAAEKLAARRECREPRELDKIVTHDLRHFCASALIAGGASVKQVQALLGHSSAVITLRVYSHLWPGDEDRTRSVMDAVLSGMRTGCGPVELPAKESAGQAP